MERLSNAASDMTPAGRMFLLCPCVPLLLWRDRDGAWKETARDS